VAIDSTLPCDEGAGNDNREARAAGQRAVSAAEWAHADTTMALWMAFPLLIGLWRITRGEVN
jgi:hypothetical protein